MNRSKTSNQGQGLRTQRVHRLTLQSIAFPRSHGDILKRLRLWQVLVVEDYNLAALAIELVQLLVAGMNFRGLYNLALGLLLEDGNPRPWL